MPVIIGRHVVVVVVERGWEMETVEKPLLHPNSVSAHKTVKVIVVVLQSFIMLAEDFLDLGGCWNSNSTTMSTD
jgi:hypothetical protein